MYVRCSECPLHEQRIFGSHAGPALPFIDQLKTDQQDIGAHEEIAMLDPEGDRLYTLFSGWACRYKRLPSGKRQVLDVLLPGDLIGLRSPLSTGGATHGVQAITRVSLCVLDPGSLDQMVPEQLALLSWLLAMLLTQRERADTHLLRLGRLRPTARLAHLLLELRWRLRRRGMLDDERCEFPLTYELLADATGMSRSQLAQSLVELRELGWATLLHGSLQFHAPERMAEACGYVEPPPDTPPVIP